MNEEEKTCENCKYEHEDMESTHCRHCIHNAEEHFEPKESVISEQEIRAKVIDDVLKILKKYNVPFNGDANYEILELKAGDKNE